MTTCRLRWALLCVAATPGALLARSAEASRTVVIERGDTIDSLARTYHVSIRDIAAANSISPDAILVDGKKLIIPDPPRALKLAPNMRRSTRIRGDRIAVRLGPDSGYRRLTMLDNGVEVLATRKAGDWYQIELPSGRTGWTRAEFLSLGGATAAMASPAVRTARAEEVRPRKTPKVARHQDDEDAPTPPKRRVARADRDDDEDRQAARRRRQRERAEEEEQESRAARRRHQRRVAAQEEQESRAARRRRQRRLAAAALVRRHGSRTAEIRRRRSRPEADRPDSDSDVVRTAYGYRGVPYRYGGSSRGGFDCSGFTSYVYNRKGVSLPHSAAEQFGHGSRVKGGEMKPGDLVFFSTTRRGISHVGIYAGDGKFVHASSGGGRVRVDNLNSGYYHERFRGARRVR